MYLFELDQTLVAADRFPAALRLKHELALGADADGAADVTPGDRLVFHFLVVEGAAVLAAKAVDHAVQGQLEFTLRIKKKKKIKPLTIEQIRASFFFCIYSYKRRLGAHLAHGTRSKLWIRFWVSHFHLGFDRGEARVAAQLFHGS